MNKILLVILTLLLSTFAFANNEVAAEEEVNYWREAWAVEIAVFSGGGFGPSFIRFAPNYSAGVSASATVNDNDDNNIFDLGFFGGPRYLLAPATYFTAGLNISTEFGEEDGHEIEGALTVGPYVGIDYYFSTHVLASAFINPYSYSYKHLEGKSSSNTNDFFSSGGIGISYLF